MLTVAMDITERPSRADESRQIAAQFQGHFEQLGSGVGAGQLHTGSHQGLEFPR
ncbi:hypothetical protein NKH77_49150 [Streptomyces sp. M19]